MHNLYFNLLGLRVTNELAFQEGKDKSDIRGRCACRAVIVQGDGEDFGFVQVAG
ncbi:MAG: hypothetical protein IPL78_21125 [Chloroflexi bacterium]|nr:hypothetical protein [Chloroflexota bacterium]